MVCLFKCVVFTYRKEDVRAKEKDQVILCIFVNFFTSMKEVKFSLVFVSLLTVTG